MNLALNWYDMGDFLPFTYFHLLKHCFSLPENSSWMTPLSWSMSPNLSWRKSVTTPFSNKNSNRANSWSRLVNVLRVWESSDGLKKSSVSANEARYHKGQSLEWHKQIHSFFLTGLSLWGKTDFLLLKQHVKTIQENGMYKAVLQALQTLTIHMEYSKSESCYWHSNFLFCEIQTTFIRLPCVMSNDFRANW